MNVSKKAAVLEGRQRDLLQAIAREYVRSAEPVGSATLVNKYGFDLSPATIRNEMAALEEQGLIEQPHTSAGRIPTEEGFRAVVEIFISNDTNDTGRSSPKMKMPEIGGEPEQAVKSLAKHLSERSGEAVIVGFNPRHVYYTGLSCLFGQPEFQEYGRVVRFSELIDRLDEIVGGVFPRVRQEIAVWIGRENPFGAQCGTVIARCPTGKRLTGMVGILGPMRMDYERCYGLVDLTRRLLTEAFA